jgi:hypothetical protein
MLCPFDINSKFVSINLKQVYNRQREYKDVGHIFQILSLRFCIALFLMAILAYFPYFEKVGLCDHHAVYVCVSPLPAIELLNQTL